MVRRRPPHACAPRGFSWTSRAAAVAIAALSSGLGWANVAHAQGAAEGATDGYKQHMENGVKLFQDKNYEAAIAEFEAAYKIRKKPNPLLNIALCYKGLFNYAKAIATLQQALASHAADMDPADQKATRDAIADMSSLLAYVSVTLYPPEAILSVDGEALPSSAAISAVPLGPGSHRLAARADGYAIAEQMVTVVSGERKAVTLRLAPDKGYVTVRGDDAQMVIAVDSKPMGTGQWAGLLSPGTHLVEMYEPNGMPYRVNVLVVAGQTQAIRRGFGGVPAMPAAPPVVVAAPPPPPPPKPEVPPSPPKRGPYGLVTGALLAPTTQPVIFPGGNLTSGAAGGARAGYRVNTNAAFELLFEYGNVTSNRGSDPEARSSLSSTRFGLNVKLMTSGTTVRMIGALGGGIVNDSLRITGSDALAQDCNGASSSTCSSEKLKACEGQSCSGIDPFFLAEVGLEVEITGVLLGAAFESYFQSTKAIDQDAYDSKPLVVLGGGLRMGYALW